MKFPTVLHWTRHTALTGLALIALFGVSCNRQDDNRPVAELPEDVRPSQDYFEEKTESDQLNSDVSDIIGAFPMTFGRTGETQRVICGCTIDSSRINERVLILRFDGVTPCLSPSRTRGGVVTIALQPGPRWGEPGGRLLVTMDNYRVVHLASGRSITINGAKTITNVLGNNWLGFLAGTDSILRRERGQGLRATFTNGATTTYSLARTTTWRNIPSGPNQGIYLRVVGDTTINGVPNVDSWGASRLQQSFTNAYQTPWQSNTYCGLWRPVAGRIVHANQNGGTVTMTFGVNEQGNTDTRDCAYGWRIDWNLARGNRTGSRILSY